MQATPIDVHPSLLHMLFTLLASLWYTGREELTWTQINDLAEEPPHMDHPRSPGKDNGRRFSMKEFAESKLARTGVAAAVGITALAGCNDVRAPGTESTSPSPAAVEPTYIDTRDAEPSTEATSEAAELAKPVAESVFGGYEYAPLRSAEILTQETSTDEMRSMSAEDFALLSVTDRMAYMVESFQEWQTGEYTYFDVDKNFAPSEVVDAWSTANRIAFSLDDPQECAKIAIADILRTSDHSTGTVYPEIRSQIDDWVAACEQKTEYSSFVTRLAYVDAPSIRESKKYAELPTEQTISVIEYEINEDGRPLDAGPVGYSTREAVELTIQLENGRTVVVYARGDDR